MNSDDTEIVQINSQLKERSETNLFIIEFFQTFNRINTSNQCYLNYSAK